MIRSRTSDGHSMRNRRIIVTVSGTAGLATAIFVGAWLWDFCGLGGFVEGKSILASLQGPEVEHRHQHLRTPDIFVTDREAGPVIVVATHDPRFPYAWIAATVPSCDGKLCIVDGNASIDITCNDLGRLTTLVAIAPPVLRLLKESCRVG